MKLFGEALEKRTSLCYTFRMKHAERLQGNAYNHKVRHTAEIHHRKHQRGVYKRPVAK